jgi:hypothetical protein
MVGRGGSDIGILSDVTSAIIAYARTAEEESRIEAALDEAGIGYSFALDAAPESGEHAVCFLARAYQVSGEEAARAKAVLRARGVSVTGDTPPRR